MKRQPKRAKKREQVIQVWTLAQARAAIPYLKSVVRSLREQFLDTQSWTRKTQRLADRPGRPDRAALIEKQEAEHRAHYADTQFEEAADELARLDVYSLDPARGQALVPFVYEDKLAWYIFDLFEVNPLRFWRYQDDTLDTRRPITSLQQGQAESTQTV